MANSFGCQAAFRVGDRDFDIFRLDKIGKSFAQAGRLPFSLKILLENLLRTEDGRAVRAEDIEALAGWDARAEPSREIAFTPSRVLLQDFTGVPAVVDLAAMRDAMQRLGGDPKCAPQNRRRTLSSWRRQLQKQKGHARSRNCRSDSRRRYADN